MQNNPFDNVLMIVTDIHTLICAKAPKYDDTSYQCVWCLQTEFVSVLPAPKNSPAGSFAVCGPRVTGGTSSQRQLVLWPCSPPDVGNPEIIQPHTVLEDTIKRRKQFLKTYIPKPCPKLARSVVFSQVSQRFDYMNSFNNLLHRQPGVHSACCFAAGQNVWTVSEPSCVGCWCGLLAIESGRFRSPIGQPEVVATGLCLHLACW